MPQPETTPHARTEEVVAVEDRQALEDQRPLLSGAGRAGAGRDVGGNGAEARAARSDGAESSQAPREVLSISERALLALRSAFMWRSTSASAEAVTAVADLEQQGDGAAAVATIPVVAERSRSSGDAAGGSSGGAGGEIEGAKPAPARAPGANPAPVCLICLDVLAPDDFGSGRAIMLGCNCRGDLALRHRDCAIKWAQVKDDGRGGVPVCELCKHPVRNLPALPPRPRLPPRVEAALADEVYTGDHAPAYADYAPSHADMVFDCVRVCWVAMIVSILFFEASLGAALWTGLVAGLAYSMMVRVMYRQHFAAMRAYAEQQAALRQPPAEVAHPAGQVAADVV